MIILHILLFVVCLSVLVVVHELGHLAAAKAFKVYCFEFSVGFGPAIFRKKRQRGETYVALRIIPFGGYVSMYGENEEEQQELPDGIESIPPERSLSKIKAWKRAIVLAAGVTLNAVLALVLFFTSNMFFVQQQMHIQRIEVVENSIAYNAGLRDKDIIVPYGFEDENNIPEDAINAYNGEDGASYFIFDKNGELAFLDTTKENQNVAVLLNVNYQTLTIKNNSYDNKLSLYELDENNQVNFVKPIDLSSNLYSYISFDLKTCLKYENGKAFELTDHNLKLNITKVDDKNVIESSGLSSYVKSYRNNFGQATQKTFAEFGESSVLIFKTIGELFIGKSWDQVGGPVKIFTESTMMLENYGATYFIRMWAIISVNLAIFNLIPFPGLDGWHLLVLGIESITRKKLPEKAKTIASFVGMILLFGLMIAIVIKDVIGLF